MVPDQRAKAEKQVITAATALMVKNNTGSIDLSEVAEECGTSRMAVRRLFGNSEGLAQQCFKSALIDMKDVLYWHSAKSISLKEKLIRICSDYYILGKHKPGVIVLFLKSTSETGKDQFSLYGSFDTEGYFNEAGEVLRYGIASGEIRGDIDLHLAGKMFTMAVLNLVERSIKDSEFHLPPSESVVDIIFNGIGS